MLKNYDRSRWLIPILVLTVAGLLTGCGSEVADDWDPASPAEARHPFGDGSHADYMVAQEYPFGQCTDCHGEELMGVELGDPNDPVRDCTACHRTDKHRVFFDNAFEHAQWMGENEYAMDECYVCHEPFEGSELGPEINFGASCATGEGCHVDGVGPVACNTCHGEFDENPDAPENWAPDKGVHSKHLNLRSELFATITCNQCHNQPGMAEYPGHYNDDTPGDVELAWSPPARGEGFGNPTFNPGVNEAGTCSNVYCHQGNEVTWMELPDQDLSCGSCHGYPPEAPHPDNTNCSDCHGSSVGDDNVSFDAPELHINGTVNFN